LEDKEKMWRAKAVLDEKLEVPPSIVELAQYVGVNEYKLKNGFRQEHGITPYRYIVEQRLERARKLLWNRDMNVTEAAFAVGYSSLSHFAKIFRDKFGVNPHEYLA
jgi:AraC-like DNA-binding protein